MDTPPVTLGPAEQRRLYVLTELLAGRLTTIEAALTLELSVRHLKRLKARYRREGVASLAHGNRGRRPSHAIDPALAERVVELAQTRYVGLNHSHLADLLAEREGITLERSTVRRVLLRAGLRTPRPRRPPAHRSRRERMAREGVLLQADGSRHRWFGPDLPFATLIGAIDDATGTVPWAVFRAQEDAAGYLAMVRAIGTDKGLPLALYIDRHGIFTKRASERLTLEEELTGTRLPTQVGRALEELGIRPIHALSPEGKGRIERMWATIQGRLVAELRLEGITTIAAANAYLPGFLARLNARFGVPAASPEVAYRPLPDGLDLERVCCFKYGRIVAADNTIRFGGRVLQLGPVSGRRSLARTRVEVHERLDGSLLVLWRGESVATAAAPPDASKLRARSGSRILTDLPDPDVSGSLSDRPAPPSEPRGDEPTPIHPWRRWQRR
ncbi:MAG: ISNCY family transposase [Candidatus Limnocylindrales bacterium]